MTLATVITPGYVGNQLVLWLLRQDNLQFTLVEAKPRERAKMEAMRLFLSSGAKRWLLINHYAAPQFALADVPDLPVVSASMNRVNGLGVESIMGRELEKRGDLIRTDFVGTGCLLMQRPAVEKISETRPFEYVHDRLGNCLASGDGTLSQKLRDEGIEMWVWSGKCLNRQEQFV